jgi:hypothetical protein
VADLRPARWVFALGFWLWAAFVAGVAGFLGSALNCEGGNGCTEGDPSWLRLDVGRPLRRP